MNNTASVPAARGKRNYGIDALRILSMIMIVTLHVLGKGGILYNTELFSVRYEAAWFLEIASFCAVNCYAMISGYVGVTSKYKYSSIILLYLRVVFFTLLITGLFAVFLPGSVNTQTWLNAVFPVCNKQYWYFTAYFGLFFFIPLLNSVLNCIPQKQMFRIIVGLTAVFSLYYSTASTFTTNDFFLMSDGYSLWWLMILYVIGGYIRLYEPLKKTSAKKLLLLYICMIVLTWSVKLITEIITKNTMNKIMYNRLLVKYTSPTILFAAIALLLLFSKIKFYPFAEKITGFLAPSAFSVYLIHTNPLIWKYIMTDRFISYKNFNAAVMVLAVIGTVLAIYLICSFIDIPREMLFRLLGLKKRLLAVEESIQAYFSKDPDK